MVMCKSLHSDMHYLFPYGAELMYALRTLDNKHLIKYTIDLLAEDATTTTKKSIAS